MEEVIAGAGLDGIEETGVGNITTLESDDEVNATTIRGVLDDEVPTDDEELTGKTVVVVVTKVVVVEVLTK